MSIFLALLAVVSVFVTPAHADEIHVSRFATDGLSGWEAKSFKGTTEYRLVQDDGRTVVKATSRGSASGMIRKISFQPSLHRYVRWSWKISGTIKGGDEKLKSGDDYAARLYVIFPGRYFWQMKAINYIWANKMTKGSVASSIYAADSKMVAVESGNGRAGQWLTEERDLLADYRIMFGTDPPDAAAIAIMTDTDNTGGMADAWYGDISLSTVSK